MNKLLSALLAGVFAATLSIGAFAADAAPATPAVDEAKTTEAAPAPMKHKAKKLHQQKKVMQHLHQQHQQLNKL